MELALAHPVPQAWSCRVWVGMWMNPPAALATLTWKWRMPPPPWRVLMVPVLVIVAPEVKYAQHSAASPLPLSPRMRVPTFVAFGKTWTVVPDATVTTWPAGIPGLVPVPLMPPEAPAIVNDPGPAEVSSSRPEPLLRMTAFPVSVPRCLKSEPSTVNVPWLLTAPPAPLAKPHDPAKVAAASTVKAPLLIVASLWYIPPAGRHPPSW